MGMLRNGEASEKNSELYWVDLREESQTVAPQERFIGFTLETFFWPVHTFRLDRNF